MEATKFELTSLSHLHMSDLLTKREEVESTGWTKALGTPKTATTTKTTKNNKPIYIGLLRLTSIARIWGIIFQRFDDSKTQHKVSF